MKKTLLIAALFPATALMLTNNVSQAGNELFKSLDTNQDASLTIDEAQGTPALLESWKVIDKNGNGNISEDEFSAYMESISANSLSVDETPPKQ